MVKSVPSFIRIGQCICKGLLKYWSLKWWDCWGKINFSKTVVGITKWIWFTIKGYLSYLLTKFEDLVPTSLGSGPFLIFGGFYRKAVCCPQFFLKILRGCLVLFRYQLILADFTGTNNEVNKVHPVVHNRFLVSPAPAGEQSGSAGRSGSFLRRS